MAGAPVRHARRRRWPARSNLDHSLSLSLSLSGPAGRLSAALGWASTGCWWLGWYPQLVSNFVRRSVAGVSLTYLAWNVTGFLAYAIFNCALFFSPAVRAEYRAAHGGADSDVRSNDVFFSVHALAMTLVAAGQAAAYGAGGQTLSVAAAAGVGGAVAAVAAYARLWAAGACGCVSALALLNLLATIKVGTTAVKYLPQILLHARARSTAGFSAANARTDLAGGALSLAQQALDAWLFRDTTLITGDLPKLGLAVLSMLYSAILIGQHAVYGRGGGGGVEEDGEEADAPLLG